MSNDKNNYIIIFNGNNREEVDTYSQKNGFCIYEAFDDNHLDKLNWKHRVSGNTISKMSEGDSLIIYDIVSLAFSISEVFEIFMEVFKKNITVHCVKHNLAISSTKTNVTKLLEIMKIFESDLIKHQKNIQGRKKSWKISGRPKGSLNKELKLDKYHKEIVDYLGMRVSVANIAQILKCNHHTLRHWIKIKGLKVKKKK